MSAPPPGVAREIASSPVCSQKRKKNLSKFISRPVEGFMPIEFGFRQMGKEANGNLVKTDKLQQQIIRLLIVLSKK